MEYLNSKKTRNNKPPKTTDFKNRKLASTSTADIKECYVKFCVTEVKPQWKDKQPHSH
jgi:hypothetical protein